MRGLDVGSWELGVDSRGSMVGSWRSGVDSPWLEVDGWKSMVGSRWLEVGSRKSVVGSWESIVHGPWSMVGSRGLGVGSRWSEVGSRWSEVGSRKSVVGSWESVVGSWESIVHGPWSMVERRELGVERRYSYKGASIFNQNIKGDKNKKMGPSLSTSMLLPGRSPELADPCSTTRNAFTRNFLPLLLCLLSFPASSQSLNDLLQSLATDNLELKVLQQEYLAAMEKGAQVSQLPQPQIGVGAFILPVETRLGGQQARASISQNLPWFGTLAAREDLALSQAQVHYEKIAGTSLELAYQLKTAYFKWYEGVQSQAIIERNMALLESSRRLALNSVENGKGSAADVLRVDLKIQELTQALRLLANQVKKPLADINQLLYRPLDTPLSKDTLSFAPLLYNRDTLQAYISNKHPAIRLFAQQQTAARQAIVVNELEGKPSFSIGADYFLIGQRTDADPVNNGRDAFQVSAKLSIPIYRKKFEAKEKEEQLKIAALENQKLAITHRFLSQIEKAFADHENAVLRRQLYLQQIETTKATLRLLQAEYSTAGRRFDELIRLEQDLIDYDLKILSTIIESQQAKAAIERYINL